MNSLHEYKRFKRFTASLFTQLYSIKQILIMAIVTELIIKLCALICLSIDAISSLNFYVLCLLIWAKVKFKLLSTYSEIQLHNIMPCSHYLTTFKM